MSDILWRDTSGNIAMWLINGSTVTLGAVSVRFRPSGRYKIPTLIKIVAIGKSFAFESDRQTAKCHPMAKPLLQEEPNATTGSVIELA
jgi:hypothetical protein